MFLKLNHQKLDIYKISSQFVFECYKLTRRLPVEGKFGVIVQIRRAALAVHLNIAEGASRKSATERKRYYEIARGSVIEIDAALDIAETLEYLQEIEIQNSGNLIINCFKILRGMINPKPKDH
jgi:four helix bundle protein